MNQQRNFRVLFCCMGNIREADISRENTPFPLRLHYSSIIQ